ncbi:cytochrome c-type biogenesis protein CcmH [Kiloniella laminariae]|uniref:Cytochrome c-type biogenesis protein n=1 Tax=Kiloniella laminariae TaxID=454162 RepID=A0ABT4LIN5_9PROT|nr:cytochrome c-type biogenesis protein [Kiloniella laminariae]MCZ4280941.1 cytochrome c-type biogenesis protein CcmH [Kiloniella laminariae]
MRATINATGLGLLFFTLMLLMAINLAHAVEPDEILDDPVLEARAREISQEVRCPVCQNEPIDSSNAELARELRLVVRERLVAGDSDEQVKNYLADRYGDFVLFRPPVKTTTYLLWAGPGLFFLLGGVGVFFFYRGSRRQKVPTPLSPEEQSKLDQLLADKSGKEDSA